MLGNSPQGHGVGASEHKEPAHQTDSRDIEAEPRQDLKRIIGASYELKGPAPGNVVPRPEPAKKTQLDMAYKVHQLTNCS